MYTRKRVISLILCLLLVVSNLGFSGVAAVEFVNAEEEDITIADKTPEEPVASNNLVDASEESQDDEVTEEQSEPMDRDSEDVDASDSVGSFVVSEVVPDETLAETVEEDEPTSADALEEVHDDISTETVEDGEPAGAEASDEVHDDISTETVEDGEPAGAEASEEVHDEPSKEIVENVEPTDDKVSKETAKVENDNDKDETIEMNSETESHNVTVDGVKITVTAEPETFPKGWQLKATRVSNEVQEEAEAAIDDVRSDTEKVAKAYTFDIKVLDTQGKEVQPVEGKNVKVSFEIAENSDSNVSATVYHLRNLDEESAEETEGTEGATEPKEETIPEEGFVAEYLPQVEEEELTVETDGFSYYTVEFTYEDKQYVIQGNSVVAIDDILEAVELTGEITKVETEGSVPFEVYEEDGNWFVESTHPFTTTHTLKVTVKEIVFDIELGYQELEKAIDLVVTDSSPTTRTITITKEWVNDDTTIRPHDLEVHLKKSMSTLLDGPNLSLKMRALSGYQVSSPRSDNLAITAIVEATQSQYESVKSSLTSANEVQESGEKTYMWFSGGTIYFYSEADNIYLNANSQSLCSKMLNLTNISGLAKFNTTYVTDMAFMFEDCVSLVNLSPLAGWDTGNVTSMRLMLGANVTDSAHDHMNYTDLTPIGNWDTQKVTDMGMMFKAASDVASLAPIANWNVSNLANLGQTFFRMYALTDATAIRNWNVVRVGQVYRKPDGTTASGNFSQMFGRSGDPTHATCLTVLPTFTYRAGKWSQSAGTFTASTSAVSGSADTSTKVQDPASGYVTDSTGTHWTKSGNIWTADFTVSNDGASWRAWEATSEGYIDGNNGVTNAYIESSSGVNGLGGSESNAITGVTEGVTFTNTNITRKELAVTVTWSDSNDLYLDRPVFNNTTGPGGVNLTLSYGGQTKTSNSDVTKWVDNGGNTWTYTFIVYTNEDISTFELSEHSVPNYEQEGPTGITVTSSPEALTQTGTIGITNKHSLEMISRHSLIIANTVTGNQGSRDKYFKVDISITNGGTSTDLSVDLDEADASIPAYPNEATTVIGSAVSQPTMIETDLLGRASATYYLKNGQFIEINNMIEGTRYTVTVTNEDYEVSSVVTGRDTDQTKPTANSLSDSSTGISATTEVVFINNRHGVIPSGTDASKTEWIPITAIAILGLLAITIKKRKGGAENE